MVYNMINTILNMHEYINIIFIRNQGSVPRGTVSRGTMYFLVLILY